MLIIIEGIDGAGKTTLADAIRAQLVRPVKRLHAGPIKNTPLEEYEYNLQWYRPGGLSVICDRWHWGERVYGPILRNKDTFTPATWLHVEKFLQSRGALLVWLTASSDVVAERLNERGDDLVGGFEMIDTIGLNYVTVATESVLSRVEINTDSYFPDADDVVAIVDMARQAMIVAQTLNVYPTYVGPPRPKHLLLGDVRGTQPATREYRAAFVPAPATSGRYLLEALPAEVRDCGIANACEEDVKSLWEDLGGPQVCTLGNNAYDRLRGTGVPHGAVPHPQWARRFRHHDRRAYGDLIYEAITTGRDLRKWT